MAFIEIENPDGTVEERELKKQSPITIGSHVSNDVVIDDPSVAIMHCRISWGKGSYEAIAAATIPLDVNGVHKQRSELHHGDILRFGGVDIRFRDRKDPPAEKSAPQETHSSPAPRRQSPRGETVDVSENAEPEQKSAAKEQYSSAGARESESSRSVTPIPAKKSDSATLAGKPARNSDRAREALRSRHQRPGEEDLLRSPLVISLTIGVGALLLTSAIFYVIASRQTAQQAFDVARQTYEEGNFRGSIEALQKFIVKFPRQSLTTEARRLLGLAKVRLLVEGGAPQYPQGLQELNTFIENQKDTDNFEALFSEFTKLGRQIALGSAEAAGKQFDPKLLEVADQARTIFKTYSPKDTQPTESLAQIEQAMRSAQALILRDDVYREHIAAIDAALTANDPLQGLQRRRDLLVRYPQFEQDKQVVDRMQKLLAAEKAKVAAESPGLDAIKADHFWPKNTLTTGFLARTRTENVADGQTVIVLAQDCCLGVEMATGQPRWRRVIGFNTPFFPLPLNDQSSVVLFDTKFQELVQVHRNTGLLQWRQPIPEGVSGAPLLQGETLYVSTRGGKVLAIAADSGQITGSLTLTQPVSAPLALSDGQHLVVAGDHEVLYTLTMRPFACSSVFNLGHAAGSIRAPMLGVASYLLVIENGNQRAKLQLLQIGADGESMKGVAQAEVIGRVIDAPALRGRDLFVPSTGVRVSTFSLSDDPGQPPLAAGPVYVSEGNHAGATYLLTGPDRQLWMATGGLSRLRLSTEALQADGDPIGAGAASQPLQFLSGSLFHARRRPASSAVVLTRTDRDEMKSDWQAMLGGAIGAWSVSGDTNPALCVVTDAGQTYRIPVSQISGNQFLMEASARLPLANDLQSPLWLAALADNRIAVSVGGQEPRYWTISAAGQIETSGLLKAEPQAAPCGVGSSVLFPLAGSIQPIRPIGQPPAQPFLLPSGEAEQWASLSPVSDDSVAAVTARGRVLLIKLHTGEQPHLGELARTELGQPVHFPAVSAQGLFAVVDDTQRLTVLQGEQLNPVGTRTFSNAVTGPPRITGGLVFIEEDRAQLHAINPADDLKTLWTLPLQKTSIAGLLDWQGELVVVTRSGTILHVDPQTGGIKRSLETYETFTTGPLVIGQDLIIGTDDGTLIRIPSTEQTPDTPKESVP